MRLIQKIPTTTSGIRLLAGMALLLLCSTPDAIAQLITGSITGTTEDSSSAAVAGASLSLTNTGTGNTQTASSNGSGFFEFLLLPSGTYVLEASNPGFRKFRQEGITVETARSISIPVVFTVGDVTETVEVVAATPLLDPNTSSLGTVMDRQNVEDLPLAARNPMALATLIPTVNGVNYFGQQVLTTNSSGLVRIGGASSASNGFLMDGMANDKLGDSPGVMTFLTVDATQEFKVITNAMPAEFGRSMGGVVSVISRSGTNNYHGSAFDFLRNSALNANDFFSNRSGTKKQPLALNQFGFVIGGPIVRQKAFFFLNYEGYRERRSISRTVTAPTLAERTGDFSNDRTSSGQLDVIYDPLTTQADPSRAGASIRSPFAGNIIPASRLSAVSQGIFRLYPSPTQPGLPFTNTLNLTQSTYNPVNRDNYGLKVDYNVNENRRLAVRYTRDVLDWTTDCYFCNGTSDFLDAGNRRNYNDPRQSASLQFIDTVSATLLLDVKSGINRDFDQDKPISAVKGGLDITSLGFPASLKAQLPAVTFAPSGLMPGLTITDMQGVGGGTTAGRSGMTWANGVSLTKVMEVHTLKIGYEFRLYDHNPVNGNVPVFTFNRGFTQGPNPTQSSSAAGSGVASFDLGYAATGTYLYSPAETKNMKYHAVYAQDDWKATHKLTFNLGLRWEYESPITDRYNVFSNFDPALNSALQVPGLSLKGGLVYPGVNGVPRGITNPQYDHFGPRFGFAYQVNPKLVVRGGYGINFVPVKGSGEWLDKTGFSASTSMVTSLNNGLTPFNTIDNPFPNGLIQPTGSSLGALTGIGGNITGQVRDFAPGYGQQMNLTVQYEPWPNWLVETAYIGNKGVHLMSGTVDLNQLDPKYLSLGNALNSQVPNPFLGLIATGQLSTPTITLQQSLLPFPQYTGVGGGIYSNLGNANYRALTVKIEKRFAKGYSFLLAYTKSKLIDDATTNTNFAGVLNWYNLQNERAKSVDDIPQRLVFSALWDLPFGKTGAGWKRKLTGGWQVNAITTVSSGPTIAFPSGQSTSAFISTNPVLQRPDVVPGVSAKLDDPTINEWFNIAAFKPAAPFTYGNASRTIPNVQAPGLFNMDVSMFKDFHVNERFTLQFRAAAFNFTNTPQFRPPNTDITSNTFGVISATGISGTIATPQARELQMALRLTF